MRVIVCVQRDLLIVPQQHRSNAKQVVTVGFGNDDMEPILGLTALESVGIEIDPVSQRLKRRPSVRIKGRAARCSDHKRLAA